MSRKDEEKKNVTQRRKDAKRKCEDGLVPLHQIVLKQ